MSYKIKAISYEQRANFFWFMVCASILSLFIYFYSVSAMARNTAIRQNLEAQLADTGGRIGGLEFSYIELKNSITSELAHQYGFREIRNPLYVSRNAANSLTLSR